MTNVNSGTFGLAGPYAVANQRLDYQAADAPLPQGSYRGLAATANHFARESAMDELAVALEIDPLELRVSHLGDERLADVFLEAAKRIDWTRERDDAVGLGIAGGIEKDARVATAVELRVDDDRRPVIERIVTAFDCGRIVNADALTNQIQGAISMALGGALFEAVHLGRGSDERIADRVPRAADHGSARGRGRADRPAGHPLGRRRRDADHRPRTGHRERHPRRDGHPHPGHAADPRRPPPGLTLSSPLS